MRTGLTGSALLRRVGTTRPPAGRNRPCRARARARRPIEQIAAGDPDECVCERAGREVRRDASHRVRQLLRSRPEAAAVREAEVDDVRDRKRCAWRREIAERDAEESERNRAEEQRNSELPPLLRGEVGSRRQHGCDEHEARRACREDERGENPAPEALGRRDGKGANVPLPRCRALGRDSDAELEERDPENCEAREDRHQGRRIARRARRCEEEEEHRRKAERRYDVGGHPHQLPQGRARMESSDSHGSFPGKSRRASSSGSGRTSRSSSRAPAWISRRTTSSGRGAWMTTRSPSTLT